MSIHPADLARHGLGEGDRVKIRSAFGETIAVVVKSEEVPEGVVFMAYGPPTSQLMGGDTTATGMPESKGLEVTIDRIDGDS